MWGQTRPVLTTNVPTTVVIDCAFYIFVNHNAISTASTHERRRPVEVADHSTSFTPLIDKRVG